MMSSVLNEHLQKLGWSGSVLFHASLPDELLDSRVAHVLPAPCTDARISALVSGSFLELPTIVQVELDGVAWTVITPPSPAQEPYRNMRRGVRGVQDTVDRLLEPDGCPWDREQTLESLLKYLLEESYELQEAVEKNDHDEIVEELGDVLLLPIMCAAKLKEIYGITLDEICNRLQWKLITRHPHVFSEQSERCADSAEVLKRWHRSKAEKAEGNKSILDGVPNSLPPLARALLVSRRAAAVGFEWPNIESVVDKLKEELAEMTETMATADTSRFEEELGDVFFTLVNLARWMGVDPEKALNRMLRRFTDRFRKMEAASTKPLDQLSYSDWDRLWESAKLS
jgi:MazG family protein